jgi:tetratricopeptide (TPR) repeat protein
LLGLRSFRFPALFLSVLIPLAAQVVTPNTMFVHGEIQSAGQQVPDYLAIELVDTTRRTLVSRAPVTLHGNSEDLVMRLPDSTGSRPLSSTVSVSRLKHPISGKARREFARSEREFHKGRLQASIERLNKAIQIEPAYMEAHNNLGARYMALTDYARAVPHLQTALQLDPTSPLAQINLSVALYFLKRCGESEQAARDAVRLAPHVTKAHYLLGLVLAAEDKDTPEAIDHLEKSAAEFPNARLIAAHVLQRRGANNSAAAELREYLASPDAQNRAHVEEWLSSLEP